MTFSILDWAIIVGYFIACAGIALWSSRKQNNSTEYFLGGKNIGWFAIGASLFASNIGSEHIVGLAGAGAKSGIAMAHYELHAWCLLILGWFLLPLYLGEKVFTMPEFLEKRFDSRCRWLVSLASLLAYIFTKVSVTVYAGGTVLASLFPTLSILGLDAFWSGSLTLLVLTGAYTIAGGLRAVIYTDALQALVLIIGSLSVTIFGLSTLGGWSELRANIPAEHFNLWKPANHPDFPWPGMLFAAPIVGLWYWCTDQYIVQRTLAAKNIDIGRRACICGAYLKLTPVFIFILPGMIALALSEKGLLQLAAHDSAFPALVTQLLPAGLKGLVIAGLLAALMSSLSSLFNSCSTLFTVDIYSKIRPRAKEHELVRVGQIATGLVVALGILWIPVIQNASGALYEYLQNVQAYLAPPLTAVFFLGIFFHRLNAHGAFWALVLGFSIGLTKLSCQSLESVSPGSFLPGSFLHSFAHINFLLFCVLLFAVSSVVFIAISFMQERHTGGPVYWRPVREQTQSQEARRRDLFASFGVLASIIAIYIYFS